MPITFADSTATFEGACAIEEAEPLLAWLREHPGGRIDLAGCEHLHAALFQLLCCHRTTLAAPPMDPFLRDRLLSSLAVSTPSGTQDPSQPNGSE